MCEGQVAVADRYLVQESPESRIYENFARVSEHMESAIHKVMEEQSLSSKKMRWINVADQYAIHAMMRRPAGRLWCSPKRSMDTVWPCLPADSAVAAWA
ncbi:hypothetical protein RAC83_001793 [Xylella fastidiosa]|nr:hypothetical protein [Xylella fastidiosa]